MEINPGDTVWVQFDKHGLTTSNPLFALHLVSGLVLTTYKPLGSVVELAVGFQNIDIARDAGLLTIHSLDGLADTPVQKCLPDIEKYVDKLYYLWVSYYGISSVIPQSLKKIEGSKCFKCKEWCRFSEPNQADGTTFICYLCSKNPYR